MTNDDLRALADALEPMAQAPRFEDFDVPAFCAYLRACADAKPVAHCAMLDSHRRVVERAIEDAARPSGMSTHDGKARIDASILRRMLAIIDSLPAAPQAEPSAALIRAYNSGYMQGHHDTVESCFTDIHQSDMDTFHADLVAELGLSAAPQAEPIADSDADYWLRNRQAILDAIERAGFMLMSNASGFWLHPRGTTDAQAEPKREPNPDEVICPACTHQFRAIPENVQAQLWAKREPLSDEQIEARDALLDFISENGTMSEGVQHYLDRYVRAALAAKETKEDNDAAR